MALPPRFGYIKCGLIALAYLTQSARWPFIHPLGIPLRATAESVQWRPLPAIRRLGFTATK
jgi:hypothetical protein